MVDSTHKIPFDACWIQSGGRDSIKRIEKPFLEFIELYKGEKRSPETERQVPRASSSPAKQGTIRLKNATSSIGPPRESAKQI